MLPTKGYFQAIECPFYDTNCGRPYCHFRHKKRPNESGEDEKTSKKGAVPTYKPTPKSELANIHNKSHIPISYVPDLAFNSVRKEKPTYNPTPISILSSARKSDLLKTNEDQKKIKDIRENILIDNVYDPSKCDINFDNLAGDFALIDDIVNESEEKGTEEGLKKLEIDIEQEQNRLNLLKSEIIEPKFSSDEETEETKPNVVVATSSVNANKEKSTKLLTKNSNNKHRKEEKKDSSSSKNNKHSSRKSSNKEKSKQDDKKSSRTHHRHSSKDNNKKINHNKKSRHKSKSPSPTSSKKKSSTSSAKSKEKSRKTNSSSSKNTKPLLENIKIEDIPSVSGDNDGIHFSEDNDLDIEDEDETLRECFKIFNEYQPEAKDSRNKSVDKLETINESSSIEDSSYQGKKRTAHSSATIPTSSSSSSSSATSSIQKTKSIILPGQMLINRYKIAKMNQADNEQANIMREIESITNNKKATIKRPAGNLLEAARQHKMKRMQEYKEKSTGNLVDDILNGVHKPGSSQHQQNQKVKINKKIAAVPNVALIEKAKERISLVKQQKNSTILQNVKTIAQTPRAGNNRIAHVPEYSLSDIPNVINADKSKLPVNVRTRFLTMIVDECFKLYALKEDAYTRALNEEFSCYEKCKVLATYKNSSMLAVNRIRKEVQERENKGLGQILSGENAKTCGNGDFESRNFYNNVKKWVLTAEEMDIHGYPKESSDDGEKGRAIIRNNKEIDYSVNENHRKCSRCGKVYQVDDDGWPLIEEECLYHPLKKRTIQREQIYLCCKTNDETGCLTSDTHVFDGLKNHFLEGYQTTLSPESDKDPRNFQVYALDCEMCYTTKGLELTRVTIVDRDCKTVYESFVKPLNPIIDYNTRFSGITKEQMDRTSTSILQVQANILHLCNSETILVGHSLESDLKALKIIHKNIIDTSVLFPHKMGLPHKRALRVLASEYLKKIIQNSVCGHDSAEDALACMDLIKWKLKEDLKAKVKS